MTTMYSATGGYTSTNIDEARQAERRAAARTRTPRAPVQPASMSTPGGWTPPANTTVDRTTRTAGPLTRGLKAVPGIISRAAQQAAARVANPTSATGTVAKVAATRLLPALSAGNAFLDQFDDDALPRYAERFGVLPPSGDGSFGDLAKSVALRAGGFASDLGSGLTMGLASRLYRDRPAATVRPPASSPGMISALAASTANPSGIVQQGTGSFADAGAAPLPAVELSGQNAGALDRLATRYEPNMPTAVPPQVGLTVDDIPENVRAARLLARRAATLRQAGLRGAELNDALAGSEAYADVATPGAQRLLAQSRDAEANQLARADRAGAREEQGLIQQAHRTETVNRITARLAKLDDYSDPSGAQRGSLIETLRNLSGDFAPTVDVREQNRQAMILAALKSGTPLEEDSLGLIEKLSGPVNGAIYKDAEGNRARYVNGRWIELPKEK
ncbi:MAG: hypothetical protein AB7F89_08805 [Pirellulaceae bacterium]